MTEVRAHPMWAQKWLVVGSGGNSGARGLADHKPTCDCISKHDHLKASESE